MSVKILLADDHKILREGLAHLLEDQADLEVVAQVDDGRAAVSLVRELAPDVVVMDISMPNLNGIEATRQITSENPQVKVIALSMHTDRRFTVGMLQAGASGFVIKDSAPDELIRAIRAVTAKQIYLSAGITGLVIKDYVQRLTAAQNEPGVTLTPREREVLQLLAEGKTTKEIASELHVSVKTIETHRHQLMKKLNIHSVAQLTKYAVREGLTPLEH